MVEQIQQSLAALKVATDVDLLTIFKGKETKVATHFLRVDPKKGAFTIWQRLPISEGLSLTWIDLATLYQEIKNISFAINGYGAVKFNNVWRRLYQVANRPVTYIEGVKAVNASEDSAPCHECGLLLPLTSLDVDHDRPQAGGEDEAVAKTFRAFGLTVASATGEKGVQISDMINRQVNGVYLAMLSDKAMKAVGTKRNRGPKAAALTTLDDRYTLNARGEILYSVAVAAQQKALLQKHCVSSLLNLQPMCGSCNSSKKNRSLKFA